MSKGAEQITQLRELDERIDRAQQRLFEQRGGKGPVGNLIEKGASSNDVWESMTPEERSLWLDIVSLNPTLAQEQEILEGKK